MSIHIAQIRVHRAGRLVERGEPVDFDGAPSWQYEPVDPAEREEWLKNTADAGRVRETNWKAAGSRGNPMRFHPDYDAGLERTGA